MSDQTMRIRAISFVEFVCLLALTMSLVALSIDAMLPALPDIASHYGIEHINYTQFIITALFAGLAIGQLITGPLSDALGRKKAIYIGIAVFSVGCCVAYFAPNYEVMLIGRFIQGLGAAGPRIITIAIVRDKYEGRDMARVMSYIMGVFILVPAVAPSIGQLIMHLSDWHTIFIVFLAIAAIVFIWLSTRLDETLDPKDRRAFTVPIIWDGIKHVLSNIMSVCYTIAAGLIFGAFIGYLNSSQMIFQRYYDVGENFPYYFGTTALALGVAFFVNAQLVKRLGIKIVIIAALIAMAVISAIFGLYDLIHADKIPLHIFMIYILLSTFCMGMLFGNFNALAMMPMGHMAGIAASVIGCLSLIVSIVTGGIIGQLYADNLTPITLGFLILSLCSLGLVRLAGKERA